MSVALQRRSVLLWTLCAAVAAGLFLAVVPGNPPGFYRDESALAYNAYTVSQTGKDEHGATLPLFFRSFGDYKSPAYTYLLAATFRVAGPSIEAARALSAVLGLLALLGLGLLAARVTGRREVGALIVLLAALTPWLFEVTRLVFEVALLPLAIVLFLLALERAGRGSWGEGVVLGADARPDHLHLPGRPPARAAVRARPAPVHPPLGAARRAPRVGGVRRRARAAPRLLATASGRAVLALRSHHLRHAAAPLRAASCTSSSSTTCAT